MQLCLIPRCGHPCVCVRYELCIRAENNVIYIPLLCALSLYLTLCWLLEFPGLSVAELCVGSSDCRIFFRLTIFFSFLYTINFVNLVEEAIFLLSLSKSLRGVTTFERKSVSAFSAKVFRFDVPVQRHKITVTNQGRDV